MTDKQQKKDNKKKTTKTIIPAESKAIEKEELKEIVPSPSNDSTEKQATSVNQQPVSGSPQPTTTNQQLPTTKGQWYVIHTYSGHENKAAQALRQRVETMRLADRIFEVVVPTRNIIVVRHGKKEEIKEKIFPGYMLVRIDLNDESWLAVRTTPGVTAFVGVGNKPTPISEKEVDAILRFTQVSAPKFKTRFSKGEAVKIVDGPFSDFLGTVDAIDENKGKVKVLVSIFGRETPVELDFLQVAKL